MYIYQDKYLGDLHVYAYTYIHTYICTHIHIHAYVYTCVSHALSLIKHPYEHVY